jgi:hypothetical protein
MRRLAAVTVLLCACAKPAAPTVPTGESTISVLEPDGAGCRWLQVTPPDSRELCRLPIACADVRIFYSTAGVALAYENLNGAATSTKLCMLESEGAQARMLTTPSAPLDVGFFDDDPVVAVGASGSSVWSRVVDWMGLGKRGTRTLRWTGGRWKEVQPAGGRSALLYGFSGDFARARFEAPGADERAIGGTGWVRVQPSNVHAFLQGVVGADVSAVGPLVVVRDGVATTMPDSMREHVEPMVRGRFLLYSGTAPRLYDLQRATLLYGSDTAVGATFWR